MSMTIPSAIRTAGTRRVLFVPGGVADLNAITVTEALAAENVSCYLSGAGFELAGEQGSIPDRRYCSSQVFEIPGEKTKTLQLTYVFNLDEPTEDEARLALTEGTAGTIIRFLQKDEGDDTFAASDWYDAVNIVAGEQVPIDGEENAVDRIRQKAFIRSEWAAWKQLVAAP